MTRQDVIELVAAALERAQRALPGDNPHATADLVLRDLHAAGVRLVHRPGEKPQP